MCCDSKVRKYVDGQVVADMSEGGVYSWSLESSPRLCSHFCTQESRKPEENTKEKLGLVLRSVCRPGEEKGASSVMFQHWASASRLCVSPWKQCRETALAYYCTEDLQNHLSHSRSTVSGVLNIAWGYSCTWNKVENKGKLTELESYLPNFPSGTKRDYGREQKAVWASLLLDNMALIWIYSMNHLKHGRQ